jgi:hypothetical protein
MGVHRTQQTICKDESSGDAVSQDVNVKKNQQLTYGSLVRFILIAGLASSNRGTPRI